MKKKIKIIGVASMLAIGLIVETGSAQTGHNTPIHKQQMHGNIKGGGMFNGGMVGMPSRKMIPAGNLRMMGSQRNQQNWVSLGCDSMTGNAMINRMSPGQQQEFLNQTVNLRKQ